MPTPPADSSPPHADPFPSSEPTHRAFNWRSAVRSLEWPNLLGILALHLGALFAIEHWSWGAIAGSVVLWWLFGGVGICLGYHRLLTHRSFACPKWLEYALTVLGAMNWEATPIRWVGQHRLHHAESDLPADPHTPHHGLLWSHLLWMFWKDPPELDSHRLTQDLLRDPMHRWIDRWSRAFNLLFAGAVFLAAESLGADGVTWVVWCVCVRGVVVFHATWSVNSLGHSVGYRNYETGDDSTNNLFVALLTFGEGWHNNHHADQRSARHGHRWFEVDLTYSLIRLLGRLGLVWNIREPRRDRA